MQTVHAGNLQSFFRAFLPPRLLFAFPLNFSSLFATCRFTYAILSSRSSSGICTRCTNSILASVLAARFSVSFRRRGASGLATLFRVAFRRCFFLTVKVPT
jgi:hypothetical protein